MYMERYLRTAFYITSWTFSTPKVCSKFFPSPISAEKCTVYTASDNVLLTNKLFSKFMSVIIGMWCQFINLSVSVGVSQFLFTEK